MSKKHTDNMDWIYARSTQFRMRGDTTTRAGLKRWTKANYEYAEIQFNDWGVDFGPVTPREVGHMLDVDGKLTGSSL